jgi:hypothetical protein
MKQNNETAKLVTEIFRADRTLLNPSIDPIRFAVDSAVATATKQEAINSLVLPSPLKKGVGNELMQANGLVSMGVNEALKAPNKVDLNASIDRVEMLKDVNLLDMGLSTAHDMKASNSVQQMLAHQLASAHKYAMENFKNSEQHKDPTVKVKFGNLAVRLMEAYSKGALTLQRLQNGNAQTVTVQHVNVEGQALITGSLNMGGQSNGK